MLFSIARCWLILGLIGAISGTLVQAQGNLHEDWWPNSSLLGEPKEIIDIPSLDDETFMARVRKVQQEHERLIHVANEYLTGLQGEFRAKGIKVKMTVVTGPVVEAIIEAAELEGVDLICIASHGRSGLSRVFYGSVAAGVRQRIDRPLLMIRSRDVS